MTRCVWGHQLAGEFYLERVICAVKDLEFAWGFDKLCIVCSDDFVSLRGSNSSQDQDDGKRRNHYEERRRIHCYFRIASAVYAPM